MVNTINFLFIYYRKVFDENSQVILQNPVSKLSSILEAFRDELEEKRGISCIVLLCFCYF